MGLFTNSQPPLIGVDISSTAVKLLQLSRVRRPLPRRALRGRAAAAQCRGREEHRRGRGRRRGDPARRQPLRRQDASHAAAAVAGLRGDHQGDPDAGRPGRGRPGRPDPGRSQPIHPVSARGSQPRLRGARPGARTTRRWSRCCWRPRAPRTSTCASPRSISAASPPGSIDVEAFAMENAFKLVADQLSRAEGRDRRAGRHRRDDDHAQRAEQPAQHLHARAGVRRQAAHRRSDAPLRPVATRKPAWPSARAACPRATRSKCSSRSRKRWSSRSAACCSSSSPAANSTGRPGRARRRLRVDPRHRRDGRGADSACRRVIANPLANMSLSSARAGAGAGAGRAGADDRLRPGPEELRLMAKINLLPWRAERRKQRQKEF